MCLARLHVNLLRWTWQDRDSGFIQRETFAGFFVFEGFLNAAKQKDVLNELDDQPQRENETLLLKAVWLDFRDLENLEI